MAQDDERGLITPPPGLLPAGKPGRTPSPAPEAPVDTGSETRRVPSKRPPTFFPHTPGAPPPEAVTPAPSTEAAVETGETPVAPEPAAPDVADTVLVGQTTRAASGTVLSWLLRLADGSMHDVPEGGLVLGRNPTAPASSPDAEPLQVLDPERSVSKTHALFLKEGSGIRVVDLASTNGTRVGTERMLVPPDAPDGLPVPDDTVVALGEYELRVRRGRRIG